MSTFEARNTAWHGARASIVADSRDIAAELAAADCRAYVMTWRLVDGARCDGRAYHPDSIGKHAEPFSKSKAGRDRRRARRDVIARKAAYLAS